MKKNNAVKNNKAVTIAVNPVLPPASIPVADSMNTPLVVVPNNAPTTVESASHNIGFSISGSSPFSSSRFALYDNPSNVPIVSTKSSTNTVRITEKKPHVKAPEISSLRKICDISGGILIIDSGAGELPERNEMIVITRIPIRIEPFTFLIIKIPTSKNPAEASRILSS